MNVDSDTVQIRLKGLGRVVEFKRKDIEKVLVDGEEIDPGILFW